MPYTTKYGIHTVIQSFTLDCRLAKKYGWKEEILNSQFGLNHSYNMLVQLSNLQSQSHISKQSWLKLCPIDLGKNL